MHTRHNALAIERLESRLPTGALFGFFATEAPAVIWGSSPTPNASDGVGEFVRRLRSGLVNDAVDIHRNDSVASIFDLAVAGEQECRWPKGTTVNPHDGDPSCISLAKSNYLTNTQIHHSNLAHGRSLNAQDAVATTLQLPYRGSANLNRLNPLPTLTGSTLVAATRAPSLPDANHGTPSVYFEANEGQTDARADFIARTAGYTMFLSATEATISIENSKSALSRPSLRMQLVGANRDAAAVGINPLSTRVNYFLGNDPSQWHTDVPTFGGVRYDDVYPGIDIVYYGVDCGSPSAGGQCLEYDFVVAPGARPDQIQLSFAGADHVGIDAAGDLVLRAGNEELRQQKPYIYQEVGKVRQEVAGEFRIQNSEFRTQDSSLITFAVGDYDETRPLVIDPVLTMSSFLGGNGDEFGRDITTDSAGNIYVSGYASSVNFPVSDPLQQNNAGGIDAFVTKLSPNGTTVLYSTYLGGGGNDFGGRVVVDSQGNAYLAGDTSSNNFPTQRAFQATNGGGTDAFVSKLSATGSSLIYSTYLGGVGEDDGRGIAVDASGRAYVTGRTGSSNFPIAHALQPSLNGAVDVFVTKFTPNGARLAYSTFLGGSGSAETGYGIAVDGGGNALVTGRTDSLNFPTSKPIQATKSGGTDAFVSKLTSQGSSFVYSTYLGGGNDDHGRRIAVDAAGLAYVVGETASSNFPTANALQPVHAGGNDAFVTKLRADGSAFVYSTYLGGSGQDQGISIAVDAAGNAYATGSTSSNNFPIFHSIQPFRLGPIDAFVTKIESSGASLAYSTYLGGEDSDSGIGIAADALGTAYVTGSTRSTDFPTVNPFQPLHHGGSDVFVAKIR